jgi:NADH dehydrogenase FAD-containing subunit
MADKGKKVVVLTERDEFVPGMGFTNRGNMFKRFFPKNVSVSTKTKVKKVIDGGLLCEKNGVEFKVSADTVIMSTKLKAVNCIEDQVKDLKVKYYKVGDCEKIGNALKAFHAGFDLADKI